MRLLTVPGSLRRDSYNRALLRAAADCAPPEVEVVATDLHGIPPLDVDHEQQVGVTGAVAALRRAVTEADAVLFSTPEYNQSVSGVLKNALDWLSRALPDKPLVGKPVAVIGATPGPWGTRYAQQTVRHVLGACGSLVMTQPTLFVAHAPDVFEGGELVDDDVRDRLTKVVGGLVDWARTFTD